MIGYSNWAKVLTRAKGDSNYKDRVLNVLQMPEAVHEETGQNLDSVDWQGWLLRYQGAINSSKPVGYQIFYHLGQFERPKPGELVMKACPTDCVHEDELTEIGEIIADHADNVEDAIREILTWFVEEYLNATANQVQQLLGIIIRLAPNGLPVEWLPADRIKNKCEIPTTSFKEILLAKYPQLIDPLQAPRT